MPATEQYLWNQKKLHKVFAWTCVALLVSVIWMMIQDYSDPWRAYQSENIRLQAEAKKRDIAQMKSWEFETKAKELEAQKRKIDKELSELSEISSEIDGALDTATRRVDGLALQLKSENALRDEARAHYDLAVRDNLAKSRKDVLYASFLEAQGTCDNTQLDLEEAQRELDAIGSPEAEEDPERKALLVKLTDVKSRAASTKKKLDKLQADVLLAEDALMKIEPPAGTLMKLKRSVMELPIIEGFNGHLKVTQDWLPELHQTLGMTEIARFDRCRTCHMNMDRTAPGNLPAFPFGEPSSDDVVDWVKENKFPHPYTTHPNHELFVTASSPHPVATFGCTSCHDGQGSGTTFGNAEHGHNDPAQMEDWHHDYGYHPNHFWEYPMQPERFQESTCLKCHHDVTELGVHPKFGASAPKLFKGFELIQKYGCFGCHEIHGYDGGDAIGPDMRLEPQSEAQMARVASDPTQVAGLYRKVGPGLKHIAAKTTEGFVYNWTQEPKAFRPTTRMPQFFNLRSHLSKEQGDETSGYEAVELAGIAKVLLASSEDIELLKPQEGYVANAKRGKTLFTERGCLACHQHEAVPGTTADFGPNISDIHKKVNRNTDDNGFSDWLYTWVKEPTRYHARTRMPDLYLDPYTSGDDTIDPAADIVAFLLAQGDAAEFMTEDPADQDLSRLDELVTLYLKKARYSDKAVKKILAEQHLPQRADELAGDESVLATESGEQVSDSADWTRRKLEYVGRRSISRYGCYGCHDIPGYGEARPIGVALQDWGRKDTSKLGVEHIEEFLHHHGEPDGGSTLDRVENAIAMAKDGTHQPEELDPELSQAYFYDSLLHHGRPGFIWQKLRDPRSYDYEKTDTKGYDERLRMPKFPLKEDEVEAIATFVLGLVAEPPAEQYVFTPDVREQTRIDGEFLIAKYNCTGCHIIELPKITYGVDIEEDVLPSQLTAADHENALDLLLKFRKPTKALTGERQTFIVDGEEIDLPLASFHGIRMVDPDPEEEDPEFRESGFDTWDTLDFGDSDDPMRVLPSSRITIPDSKLVDYEAARGGAFAEFLVSELTKTTTGGNRNLAWQASPPPLYQEGLKVQTPWLYQFLLEPEKIRYTTALRMPKFNLSPEEAQALANYFAAVDGADFPYQELKPTDRDYIADKQKTLTEEKLLTDGEPYMEECWKSVNGPLCIKCHSVGARKFKVSDPKKDIQGPNLNRVQSRLRADWVKLWLYKPTWITPYTSMPVNFPKNNSTQFPDLFQGDPDAQIIGTRDGLFNYATNMEDIGPTVYAPPAKEAAEDSGAEE